MDIIKEINNEKEYTSFIDTAKYYGNQELVNLDLTSDVVNDSILPIFLNRFSYDQNGQFNFNANATYGASFLCSLSNSSALGNKEINSSIGTTFILFSSNAINNSNSGPDKRDLDRASALCCLISVNNKSGAIKSSLGEKIIFSNLPAIKEEITILASITNNIYFNSSNFFLYLLYNPSFTLAPNLSASFSESFDLAVIDLNSANSAAFSEIALRAISDQFNSGNESISFFKSSGTANVNVGILYPPLTVNASNYVYYVKVYKSFENKKKIKLKITEEMDKTVYMNRIYLRVDEDEILEFYAPESYEKLEFVAEGHYIERYKIKENKQPHCSLYTDYSSIEVDGTLSTKTKLSIFNNGKLTINKNSVWRLKWA